ncbi:hypothetical protein ZOSMA_104G00110 [Zostera marina]|uniref:Uncharacterized protein n=1 Tax=Zostera marina TaxID=29655 RepID=A0A0K9Q510_ZOSMR|nr:hypothetical protein ZOSMA_104G00110 [Zostera marina]
MAAVAMLSDLLKRTTAVTAMGGNTAKASFYSSHGILSTTVVASIAGFSASRGLLGEFPVSYCDAGIYSKDDSIPDMSGFYGNILHKESSDHIPKIYPIQLKSLFSAFGLKSFAVISLRSFLMFYLPLLEPRIDEDADSEEDLENAPVDLVIPFKKSIKQIVRETSVITTRRVLERLSVHYVSQRMAWKLLKDIPKSAKRKALRGLPTSTFLYCVSRSTLRGHLLGVTAAWLVQIGIEVYHCFFAKSEEDGEMLDRSKSAKIFMKKFSGMTVRCCASLAFASIGAGVGSLCYPSIGQWIGCAMGDFAGPVIITICAEKFLQIKI